MKIKIYHFTAFLLCLFTNSVSAQMFGSNERYSQNLNHINAGIEGLYNINPGKNFYSAGYGVSIKYQYDVTQNLGVTLGTGFYNLLAATGKNSLVHEDLKYIPLKLGGKAYLLPEIYFGGEVGIVYANPSVDARGDSHLSKVIAPSFGYESNSLDISIRYDNISQGSSYVSVIALRAAYIFNF